MAFTSKRYIRYSGSWGFVEMELRVPIKSEDTGAGGIYDAVYL